MVKSRLRSFIQRLYCERPSIILLVSFHYPNVFRSSQALIPSHHIMLPLAGQLQGYTSAGYRAKPDCASQVRLVLLHTGSQDMSLAD
jgi:hypothetical protein